MSKHRKNRSAAPASSAHRFLRKPWLFAGAAVGLDLAMLIMGLVLSRIPTEGSVIYTANGSSIEKTQPLAFFGVIAAVVLAVCCVLSALIIAGAFVRKKRAPQILGAVWLMILSIAMTGASAYMVFGLPARSERYYSYSDETHRLIIEETEPYSGRGTVSFYLTGSEQEGTAVLLARTDIGTYSDGADRYEISWVGDKTLTVDFIDGANYRTLTIPVEQ